MPGSGLPRSRKGHTAATAAANGNVQLSFDGTPSQVRQSSARGDENKVHDAKGLLSISRLAGFVVLSMKPLFVHLSSPRRSALMFRHALVICCVYVAWRQIMGKTQADASRTLPRAAPRVLGYYHVDSSQVPREEVVHIATLEEFQPVHRRIEWRRKREFEHSMADPLYEGDCVPMHSWQETTFLTCNRMHEIDMSALRATGTRLVSNGHWRDVWRMKDFDGEDRALKTQRYEHDYEERNYDRHRRDAVSSERLSGSPYVIDQYAFCQNSGISEFADGEDLEAVADVEYHSHNRGKLSPYDKLRISFEVSQAMDDLHNTDKDGQAAIAHTDIALGQFVFIDGVCKMNDFNRARFLRLNKKTGETCPFTVGSNKGDFRSPEEYRYDPETEKVDIYSMGNIFHVLLLGRDVFHGEFRAKKLLNKGKSPPLPETIKDSRDPATVAVVEAMNMCHVHDPKQRATAREVSSHLKKAMAKFDESGTYIGNDKR